MTSSELNPINKTGKFYRSFVIFTILSVYLLILAGGIVRSTGSGMGCPDWPKCFGMWIPPTDASQLPADYQTIFGAKLKGEVEFNATKTWIEYANRLLGALTGLFIFVATIASVRYLRKDPIVFYCTLLSLLLTGFQGWLGSKVVSSELSPSMVTLHMLLAIVIVFVLLYAMARSYVGVVREQEIPNKPFLNRLVVLIVGLTLTQILLGTQVREAIDEVIVRLGYDARDAWVSQLGIKFYIHRSFSALILLLHLGLGYSVLKNFQAGSLIYQMTMAIIGSVVIEIATGITMAYLGVPALAQPIHLTLAVVAVGLQFVLLLVINSDRVFKYSVRHELQGVLN